jgi:hypothetical protein
VERAISVWKGGRHARSISNFCKGDWGEQTENFRLGIKSKPEIYTCIWNAMKKEHQKMQKEARDAKRKQETVDEQETGYSATGLTSIDPRANPDDSSGEVPAGSDNEVSEGED